MCPLSGLSAMRACDTCTRVAPLPELASRRAAHARARAQAALTRFFESRLQAPRTRGAIARERRCGSRAAEPRCTSRQARACERESRARWSRLARGVCFGYRQGSPRDADAGARARDKNLTSPYVLAFRSRLRTYACKAWPPWSSRPWRGGGRGRRKSLVEEAVTTCRSEIRGR